VTALHAILATATTLTLLAATPAAAAVKVATLAGTISNGFDYIGTFGPANTSLTNLPYKIDYIYDKALGTTLETDGVSYETISGGTSLGTVSPIIAVRMTINGVTRSVPGTGFGLASTTGNYAGSDDSIDSAGVATFVFAYSYFNEFSGATTLDQNTGPIPVFAFGVFQFSVTDSNGVILDSVVTEVTGPATYSVRDAVPEPASWAMLIAGFGLTGAWMRRRRVAVIGA
jgi:hypothetical protein